MFNLLMDTIFTNRFLYDEQLYLLLNHELHNSIINHINHVTTWKISKKVYDNMSPYLKRKIDYYTSRTTFENGNLNRNNFPITITYDIANNYFTVGQILHFFDKSKKSLQSGGDAAVITTIAHANKLYNTEEQPQVKEIQQVQEQQPQVQEEQPQVQEQQPQVQEQQPQVQEQQPQVQEEQPQVQEQQPQVQEQQPQVQEEQPQVKEEQSQVQEEQPQVKEEQPQVKEEQPQVQEEQPQVQEEQPQVQEEQPQVQEEQPQVQEEQPQVQEEQPQVQEKSSTELQNTNEDNRKTNNKKLLKLLRDSLPKDNNQINKLNKNMEFSKMNKNELYKFWDIVDLKYMEFDNSVPNSNYPNRSYWHYMIKDLGETIYHSNDETPIEYLIEINKYVSPNYSINIKKLNNSEEALKLLNKMKTNSLSLKNNNHIYNVQQNGG